MEEQANYRISSSHKNCYQSRSFVQKVFPLKIGCERISFDTNRTCTQRISNKIQQFLRA